MKRPKGCHLSPIPIIPFVLFSAVLCTLIVPDENRAAESPQRKWVQATAYAVPKQTAPEGEGYFSIVEGHNRRLYIGTHANGVNSWLVEFDPGADKDEMRIVVDVHKEIGTDLKGFGAQAKIHTRNNVGKKTGRIYFGSKQGYPSKTEKREDYPGGYPMVYDPQTDQTRVYPIPVLHQGINSIAPDESRGLAYISTPRWILVRSPSAIPTSPSLPTKREKGCRSTEVLCSARMAFSQRAT